MSLEWLDPKGMLDMHEAMTEHALPGYVTRPAALADAGPATELYNACEIAETGEPDFEDGEIAHDWSQRDLANEITLVFGPDGTPVGSLELTHHAHVVVDADIYVHPDHSGRGIGTYLIELSERRARHHVALAPSAARVVLRNAVNGWNREANALLQRHGYKAIRHFYRMVIEHDGPPAEPDWPADLIVRPCAPGDERAIFATIDEAFHDHWSMGPTSFEEWKRERKSKGFDPDLWFQVFAGDEMVAACVCHLFSSEMGWVNDLAVRRPWRQRGIATSLLRHLFGAFYRRGISRVGLGVDAQNPTGATRLYERVGMRPVREYIFYEKVLRDGAVWDAGR